MLYGKVSFWNKSRYPKIGGFESNEELIWYNWGYLNKLVGFEIKEEPIWYRKNT